MTLNIEPFTKDHQSAFVIDVRDGFTGSFKERVNRLSQSVNGGNIKVDFFTLHQGGLSAGLGTSAVSAPTVKPLGSANPTLSPGLPASSAPVAPAGDVHAEVRKALAAYNMVAIVTPGYNGL